MCRGHISNPIYRAREHQYIMAAPGGTARIVTKPVRVDHTKCSGGACPHQAKNVPG